MLASIWLEERMNNDCLSVLMLCNLITKILNDSVLLERVASVSYKHQLGFEKYILSSESNGYIRIHFWPTVDSERMEDVHSHCSAFVSKVLFGQLTSQSYRVVSGDRFLAYCYKFDEVSGKSVMHSASPVSIEMIGEEVKTQGDEYFVGFGVLHRVINVAPGTLTMSKWGPRLSKAVVVKSFDVPIEESVRFAGMDAVEVRERLSYIKELVQ